ncbi:MAG: amino-acid N-acetyltransferase [Deltaproteobacteria bacterium]|nr:amino-acid N-acetyltransferase [Deltaproteobacteria bacterium]
MSESPFLEDFRLAAPYIRAHRGKTFVVVFGGEAMRSRKLPELVQDVVLLHSLGVRLVLVAGSRPQIERRIAERGGESRYHDGLRITDADALAAAKEAAGVNRVELERLLTVSLPGSPMAGARVRVAAGNFVTARPCGVLDGVDFQSTGRVRRVDAEAIRQRLDDDAIVILTPLGYSLTGEAFNLSTPELAAETAVALGAEKVIALAEAKTWTEGGERIGALTLAELDARLGGKRRITADLRLHLEAAALAIRGGVRRAHVLPRKADGALVRELFTREGIGTLISREPYEDVRRALPRDVPALLQLLEPLADQGVLVHRPREVLENDIERFRVLERDGLILACAAIYPYPTDGTAELACLAVSSEHRSNGRGEAMLGAIEREAKELGLASLFVLTTQSHHFFRQHGFVPAPPSALPATRPPYDRKRRSKVLTKKVSGGAGAAPPSGAG